MKVTVIGTGYVGLVTGTCFAEVGNDVVCVDIDKAKVQKMQNGQIPIYEPGLEELFKRNINEKRLTFTTELADGLKDAEVVFLALPTPSGEDGSADLSYVLGVADKLGSLIKKYIVIVNKSTVPVGTARLVTDRIKKKTNLDFDVISNPEFLREGFAVEDFMKPDRVVVGTSSQKAKKIMEELYKPLLTSGNPLLFMDERSSEMTKYAANSFLATKISFMNEAANLCEKLGANVDDVRAGIGSDPRIGNRFLFPGIGYGGSCFPKDVLALNNTALQNDYDFKILQSVMVVNELQKKTLFRKVKAYYKDDLKGKKFALWGLAFKPDTDDMREAPAVSLINDLIGEGATIKAFDPEAAINAQKLFENNNKINIEKDLYNCLKDADALLIATEWNEFRSPDFSRIKKLLNKAVIFDGRNIYEPTQMKELGFYYDSIGRPVNE